MKNIILTFTFFFLAGAVLNAGAQLQPSHCCVKEPKAGDSEKKNEGAENINVDPNFPLKNETTSSSAAGTGKPQGCHLSAKQNEEPVVVMDGEKVSPDSLEGKAFRKITVLNGVQALNILGPAGVNGLWIVQTIPDYPELKEEHESVSPDNGNSVEKTCRKVKNEKSEK